MKKISKFVTVIFFTAMCAACQNTQKTQPVPPKIVPAVEIKRPETPKHVLGIIGAVEPIYICDDYPHSQKRKASVCDDGCQFRRANHQSQILTG